MDERLQNYANLEAEVERDEVALETVVEYTHRTS